MKREDDTIKYTIGLHVSLRCRDFQIILGIDFWSKKIAVANDEKENQ